MPEAATALLALWNDVDPAREAEYEQWHAREHVPERLTVPGMLWALRLRAVGAGTLPRYLTLYGLRDQGVLESAPYRRLLAEPTPASRSMRPALRHIARWVCRLDLEEGIARCDRVDVRTASAADPVACAPAGAALLLATRLPEAAELPWLTAGQAHVIGGDRLEALAHAHDAPAVRGATPYRRLPIG